MNEYERKILFQLLIDLFIDGEQQENKQESSKQQQGEDHESIPTTERKRTRERHR